MKKVLCIITAILAWLQISANERPLSFKHINHEDGLSSVSITDIYPDKNGIIWIATSSGLDRYDGNSITTYCPTPPQEQSTTHVFIKQIAGSDDGFIYVLYSYSCQIAALNTLTGEFSVQYSGYCNYVTYHDGLWIGSREHLLYSRGHGEPATSIYSLPKGYGDITAIHNASDGSIWLGTSSGKVVILKGVETDGVSDEPTSATEADMDSSIYRIYEDSKGTTWICSLKDGVLTISKDGKRKSYRHNPHDPGSISSNYVRSFCEDNLGNIWIGTYTGLDCIDPTTGKIRRHNPETMRSDAISHSSVWSIKKDRQGTMWVGTYYGGVNYFNPEYDIYSRYPVSAVEGLGLSSPIVSKVIYDSAGNLWVATEGGGLNFIDRNTGRTRWYNTKSAPGYRLSENNIKDMIYVRSENTIWVGLHLGGINSINLDTGRIRTYKSDPAVGNSLPSDDVLDIADYGDSLIVRAKSAVCVMDKKTGRCRPIEPLCRYLDQGGYIRMMFVDNDRRIWTHKGNPNSLSTLIPPYVSEKVYTEEETGDSFCCGPISGFMQDASGKIWIASAEKGLYIYSSHDNTFTSIGEEDKFKGIGYLAESPASGNIVCSSEDGFIIFNPITRNISHYGKSNGFPLKNSKTQCITILPTSEILIAGQGGLVSVLEKDLDIPKKPYRLFFTELAVNGKKIHTGSEILPVSMPNTGSITLPANTASIELFFSSSNHIAINQDPIEYRLEGFDKNWKPVQGERKISYTNLSPGKYRLHLRPASDISESICPPISLYIKIAAPWYLSWMAILVYFIILGAATRLFISIYTSRVQMREFVRHEKERAAYLEELNQAKLRFFTNISHEIRTPLTIIIAEIESIIQNSNFTPSLYRKVLGIYKNSMSLRELISELMEFRKQELGQMSIKVAPHNLVSFIREFHLLFSEYAAGKGISLSMKSDTERLEVWYDQVQMQKVVNNILSNAIKFTPEGGSVTVKVYSTEASAIIEIADTGCGIPEKDLKNIFDRFYQVEYSSDINTGTGIGLALAQGIIRLHNGSIDVESSEGNGTMFRITLPLGYSHFSQDQLMGEAVSEGRPDIADKISIPTGKPTQEAQDIEKEHTVVIAEDNEGILEMLVELFSPLYNVVTASDGNTAIKMVREHMPSLVVSDVLMPGMNGTQLCRLIKKDPTTCHIPVVLLTARVEVEQNMEGLQNGADDYITKPFNSTLLLARCNNLVNSRIMLQEKYGKEPQSSVWMNATNRLDGNFLEKVTETIYDNLDNSAFDISELIKILGLSRTSFFRKLKAVSGQTPTEFIQTIRLKKGADMLRRNPEMNISEISDAVGFNTPKYFAKCFKDYYGKSPLTWRKEYTETN